MPYSAIEMSYDAPAQNKSVVGALVGAAIGAVAGAVVLAAVVTVDRAVTPTSLYAATAVRPAVTSVTSNVYTTRNVQARTPAGAQFASAQGPSFQGQDATIQAPQGIAVYSWAFVLFAAVAGAVNGLFLWNNRRVALAATTGRREALMAGAAAASLSAAPAFAAYGDAANVFGKKAEVDQFFEISGPEWKGTMPGKYNVSKEAEQPGIVGRWEDNFDAVNNGYVIVRQVGKNSVTELGNLDEVRNNVVAPLLGQQAYDGTSISEGGFAPGRYANAAVLDQSQQTKDGKTYYYYEFLTRTADGNEGGRHQLYVVVASNGKLIIFKQQAGDKRWFKGLERPLRKSIDAFRAL